MTPLPPDMAPELAAIIERWSRGEKIDIPTLRKASRDVHAYIETHMNLLPGQVTHLATVGGSMNQDATAEESRRILIREGLL